jgi:hypothetical protein
MAVKALGRLFDIGIITPPVADTEVAMTGKRLHLKNYDGVAFVIFLAAVSAGTDTYAPTVKEANAASGGTSQDLASGVTYWHNKNATAMDNTETWAKVSQAAAAAISIAGASLAAKQIVAVIEVTNEQLSDGFEWVSLDWADPGSGGTRAGAALAILWGLNVQRRPENLANLNA